MTETNKKEKSNIQGFEKVANFLPHPIYIFIILTLVVFIISGLLASLTFTDPATNKAVAVQSLLSAKGLQWFLDNMVKNLVNFKPLGVVLVVSIGLGVADNSGLMKSAIQGSIMNAPKSLITSLVIFVGLICHVAGDASFVIVPPLAAIIFKAVGRHPIAGLAAGFASIAGGLSACIFITTTDILLSGITETAAKIVDPKFTVHPAVNWYFMAASTIMLTIVGTIIIDKVVEPRLGKYVPEDTEESDKEEESMKTMTVDQKAGLKAAGIASLIYIVLISLTIIPRNGILRGPKGTLVPSPFLSDMVPIIMLLFLISGIVYGIKVKTIKNMNTIVKYMTSGVKQFGGFIVLCFFAAQFVESFSYSKLGKLVAVNGSRFLTKSHLTGLPLIICFLVVVTFINFLIGSASAKWALLAPIFVPMFMKLGYTPYFTQAVYRIGDAVTNCISPLEPFMPFAIIIAQKYKKNAGLGTVIKSTLPVAIGFWVSWVLLLIIFYLFKLPFGPGAPIYM